MTAAVPTPRTLDEFIETLRSQRGLHRKIRLLGHYWRQVRDLPPEDRQRVALALGSDAAWSHLEKLFAADGRLSEGEMTIKRALRRVGRAEPKELKILARRLRSGDYAEVGGDLLDAMSQALEDEAGDAEAALITAVEGTPPTAPLNTPPDDGVQPAEPTADAAPSDPAREVVEIPARTDPTAMNDSKVPDAETPQPSSQSNAEVAAVAAAPHIAPALTQFEEAGPSRAPSPAAPPPHPVEPEGSPMLAPQRARQMARLPLGWRRRRLLRQWLDSGEVTGVDEALDLIAMLGSATAVNWALGDVIHGGLADDTNLDRVLAAAPSAGARRRLQRRYQRRT